MSLLHLHEFACIYIFWRHRPFSNQENPALDSFQGFDLKTNYYPTISISQLVCDVDFHAVSVLIRILPFSHWNYKMHFVSTHSWKWAHGLLWYHCPLFLSQIFFGYAPIMSSIEYLLSKICIENFLDLIGGHHSNSTFFAFLYMRHKE